MYAYILAYILLNIDILNTFRLNILGKYYLPKILSLNVVIKTYLICRLVKTCPSAISPLIMLYDGRNVDNDRSRGRCECENRIQQHLYLPV